MCPRCLLRPSVARRGGAVRLTRVHAPAALAAGALLELPPRAALHLVRVLRLSTGAALAVFDGQGHEHAATIETLRGERITVRLGAPITPAAESPLAITLAQGVSRGERMDFAVQKATELGVARIVPLLCERSVVRLDAAQAERKREHWQGVAASAAEQCGRAVVPEVAAPRTLVEHLGRTAPAAAGEARLVLAPRSAAGPRQLPEGLARLELLVGPEGGLSEPEFAAATRCGFAPLRLGPRTLRTETAALAAVAVLQALRGDLG